MASSRKITSFRIFALFFSFAWLSIFISRSSCPSFDGAQRPANLERVPSEKKAHMLIVVLTYNRDLALKRLLKSLYSAHYGDARIDIHINVDVHTTTAASTDAQLRCLRVATGFSWPHGKKTVNHRFRHAGLSLSWFESAYSDDSEFIAIFEDDMEVSLHFYQAFRLLLDSGSLSGDAVTGFCLHPGDWDVRVARSCDGVSYSKYLYLSPEPCNWGPIWKQRHWREYLDWVFEMKTSGMLPFVPSEVAFEYNSFLKEGKDVQSSWVWRYNFDFKKYNLRYSFAFCSSVGGEKYLAINHKEPGEHFSKKMDIQNERGLLRFDPSYFSDKLSSGPNGFKPQPFPGYHFLYPLGANILGMVNHPLQTASS